MATLQEHLDRTLPKVDYNLHHYVHTAPKGEQAHRADIISDLKKRQRERSGKPSAEKRVHVGAAGFFNFDMVLTGHHDACVLVDINDEQIAFWKGMFALVNDSADLDALHANFAQRARDYFPESVTDDNHRWIGRLSWDELTKNTVWSVSPDHYRRIRQLVLDGRMAAVPVDVFDEARCREVAAAIGRYDDKGGAPYKVDTVYGSNIWDFVGPKTDLGFFHDFMQYMWARVMRLSSEDPETFKSMLAQVTEQYFAERDFRYQMPNKDQMAAITKHAYLAIKSGHTHIDRAQAFEDGLRRDFTLEDYEQVGIIKQRGTDFYAREVQPHLGGLNALAGHDQASVYICETRGRSPVTKMGGIGPGQRF